MMKIIYKYTLDVTDFQEIEMPFGSKIIKVAPVSRPFESDKVVLWCICPSDSTVVKRGFVLIATGRGFDDKGLKYVDSVIFQKNSLVFHLFDKM